MTEKLCSNCIISTKNEGHCKFPACNPKSYDNFCRNFFSVTFFSLSTFEQVVVLLLLEVVLLATAIPLENPSDSQDSKYLASQVRQKRGWGYETAWVPSHGPVISTAILGPSKTIVAAPAAVAVSAPLTTSYVVPQRVATAVAVPSGHHAESFVYSSGPDHTYYVHQRHTPHTTYYYQPTSYYPATTAVLTHPATHYIAGSPVYTSWR